MNWTTMIVAFTGLLVVRRVCLIVYRLYLHPLAPFPGPKLAAASKLYELCYDLFIGIGGQFCFRLDQLHRQYGPIVRVGPNEVHVKDSSWVNALYAGPRAVRDRDPTIARLVGTGNGTFGTVPHRLHRLRRTAITPAFSRGSILDMEPRIRDVSDRMCESLRRQSDDGAKPVDIRIAYLAWSADFITSCIFEEGSLDLLNDDQRAVEWFHKISSFSSIFPWIKQWPWIIQAGLNLPLKVVCFFAPSVDGFLSNYKRTHTAAEAAHTRWRQGSTIDDKSAQGRQNIYTTLLKSTLPPEEKTVERLHHEAFQILGAGTLTTARVLSMATYFVLADMSLHRRLQRELDELISDPTKMPGLMILEDAPLLSAVIKEALRISQPIMTRFPMVCPEEDLRYNDWVIPRGTAISMTTSCLGIDPEIFTAPQDFRPERWMEAADVVDRLKRSSIPFGKGSRQCLGMELAYAELYIGLATIFRKLDLVLFDTIRERDIDYKSAGMLGEPSPHSKGIRVYVKRGSRYIGE